MPNNKVYLGKIKDPLPLKEMEVNMLRNEGAAPLRVNFDDGQSALLDISNPRAAVWARMVDMLQQNNRPAYVDVDADTEIITRLCIPIATKVLEISPADEGTVFVALSTSDARHSLRRDLPGFQEFYDLLQHAKDTDSAIMVTATPHGFEIIDVRALPSSFGSGGPDEEEPPQEPIVPVSPERAAELFKMVSDETCTPAWLASPCIPYKYPYSGCNIRAHLMCYAMIAAGATPEKVWIYGKLTAHSFNVPQCEVHWSWHVAPTLMVTQPDGPPIKMVIDPSLCEGPVTEKDWKLLQSDDNAKLTPRPWEGYNFPGVGTATLDKANNDMQEYRGWLADLWAKEGLPPYKCSPEEE